MAPAWVAYAFLRDWIIGPVVYCPVRKSDCVTMIICMARNIFINAVFILLWRIISIGQTAGKRKNKDEHRQQRRASSK